MKQKLFTLLTLALLGISSAWGDSTIYSWQGASGGATETGGTASASEGILNQQTSTVDGTFYVMKLAGNSNGIPTSAVTISLNTALAEGDQIKVTGFQNKDAHDKVVYLYLRFKNNDDTKGNIADNHNWVNLKSGSDSQSVPYANAEHPETKIFTVTSSLAGSETLILTRNSSGGTGTNLWINKIEIIRPAVGPKFTSTFAGATNVALSPTITMTADKDITAVGGTIAGTLNGEAITFTRDGRTLSYTPASNLSYDTEYTVVLSANQVQDGESTKNAETSFTFTTRPENFTVSYNVSSYKGTVANIFGNDVTTDDDYTLPATNKYLSSDNKTQTGWSDGTTTYALGATIEDVTSNITLTPVFTSNAGETMVKTLKGNDSDYNVTWNFRASNATLNLEGTTGYLIQQQSINGAPVDMPIYINTASGKVNNFDAKGDPRTDQWAQINYGTVLTIPVINNSVVTLNTYNEASSTTINGGAWDATSGSTGNYTATYTYTGAGGTIDIVADGDISYISTINVTYPYDPSKEFVMSFKNTVPPGAYFNITNTGDVTTAIGGSGSSGVGGQTWSSASSGYSYALGAIYGSSGKNATSALVTKAKYNNISEIELEVARGSSSDKLSIEISPYADFSSSVTGVAENVEIGSNNRTFNVKSYNSLSASGYIRITFKAGSNSVTCAMTYLKVTAHGGTENISTASGKNYATYVTANALDFSTVSDDIKAYVAASDPAGGKITFTGKDAVPAGTPILVKTASAGATVNVPVATSAPAAVGTNKLVAGTGAAISYDAGESQFYYILTNGQFKAANNSPVAVGKAYLSLGGAPAANELTISFDDEDGGVTGIAEMKATRNVENETFYDLQGRRVAQPAKGLYIVNGKKVVLK